jgi:hypothetical protein
MWHYNQVQGYWWHAMHHFRCRISLVLDPSSDLFPSWSQHTSPPLQRWLTHSKLIYTATIKKLTCNNESLNKNNIFSISHSKKKKKDTPKKYKNNYQCLGIYLADLAKWWHMGAGNAKKQTNSLLNLPNILINVKINITIYNVIQILYVPNW